MNSKTLTISIPSVDNETVDNEKVFCELLEKNEKNNYYAHYLRLNYPAVLDDVIDIKYEIDNNVRHYHKDIGIKVRIKRSITVTFNLSFPFVISQEDLNSLLESDIEIKLSPCFVDEEKNSEHELNTLAEKTLFSQDEVKTLLKRKKPYQQPSPPACEGQYSIGEAHDDTWYFSKSPEGNSENTHITTTPDGTVYCYQLTNRLSGKSFARKVLPSTLSDSKKNTYLTVTKRTAFQHGHCHEFLEIKFNSVSNSNISNLSEELDGVVSECINKITIEEKIRAIDLYLDLGTSSITAMKMDKEGHFIELNRYSQPENEFIEEDKKQFPSIVQMSRDNGVAKLNSLYLKSEIDGTSAANVLKNLKNYSRHKELSIPFYGDDGSYKNGTVDGGFLADTYSAIFAKINEAKEPNLIPPPQPVKNCMVASPSVSNSHYEETLRGILGHLDVGKINFIHESDASLVYFLDEHKQVIKNKCSNNKSVINVVVCDIGAGTMDTTIAKVSLNNDHLDATIINKYSSSCAGNLYDFLIAQTIHQLKANDQLSSFGAIVKNSLYTDAFGDDKRANYASPYAYCQKTYNDLNDLNDNGTNGEEPLYHLNLQKLAESTKTDESFWKSKEAANFLATTLDTEGFFAEKKLKGALEEVSTKTIEAYMQESFGESSEDNLIFLSGRGSLWSCLVKLYKDKWSDSVYTISQSETAKSVVISGIRKWQGWEKGSNVNKRNRLQTDLVKKNFYACKWPSHIDFNYQNINNKDNNLKVTKIDNQDSIGELINNNSQQSFAEGLFIFSTSKSEGTYVHEFAEVIKEQQFFSNNEVTDEQFSLTLNNGDILFNNGESLSANLTDSYFKYSHWPRLTKFN